YSDGDVNDTLLPKNRCPLVVLLEVTFATLNGMTSSSYTATIQRIGLAKRNEPLPQRIVCGKGIEEMICLHSGQISFVSFWSDTLSTTIYVCPFSSFV